ncbi:MAG: hypothetical protein MR290_04935 [Ruminococcus sp.]|nr:hypothetical protein [Ruminococcus sp.]
MRKISACGFIFFVMLFFSSCAVSKPNGTVKLSVVSPEGTPIPDVYVYAEKYADGREIFPGPLLGVTDKNGILEYTPEQYGAQELTFLQYGFTSDGKERRTGESAVPYGIVSVEITREAVRENRVIPIQIASVSFTEEQ